MRIYGITGTNGKTTTTWILGAFLRAAGRPTGHVTTVEVDTLARQFSSGYTTPPLAALKEIFAEMAAHGATDCVMEVSSHAIHQRRTGDTVFAGGGFTNLTEDHLDYHKTMAAYFEAKTLFFRRLAAENPGAPAAVCIDGDYGRKLAATARGLGLAVTTCGFAPDADLRPDAFDLSALPLVGRYNVQNVLVAAALAAAAGVPHATIQTAIPTLTPRWGRLERVPCASRAAVYVDYAHTDDALANVLSTAREFTRGRLWAVFGAGGDRDRAKRPLMGRAAAAHADRLVVTSDNPRSEAPAAILAEICAGIPSGAAAIVEADRRAAIHRALAEAAEGDVVIVCGKGHETTQEIRGVKHPFDDRAVVREFVRA